jgi:hypothetical protein
MSTAAAVQHAHSTLMVARLLRWSLHSSQTVLVHSYDRLGSSMMCGAHLLHASTPQR